MKEDEGLTKVDKLVESGGKQPGMRSGAGFQYEVNLDDDPAYLNMVKWNGQSAIAPSGVSGELSKLGSSGKGQSQMQPGMGRNGGVNMCADTMIMGSAEEGDDQSVAEFIDARQCCPVVQSQEVTEHLLIDSEVTEEDSLKMKRWTYLINQELGAYSVDGVDLLKAME
jgi:hypothetical protein